MTQRTLLLTALVALAGCADLFAEGPPIPPPPSFSCPLPSPAEELPLTPVDALEPAPRPPDPYPAGCFVPKAELHRLSRAELERALGDLVYTPVDVASSFPADELTAGFDNNANILTASPLFTERLFQAAERAVDAGLAPTQQRPRVEVYDDASVRRRGFDRRGDLGLSLLTERAEVPLVFAFPDDGRYYLRVRAGVFRFQDRAARFSFTGPGGTLAELSVDVPMEAPEIFEVELEAQRGIRGVTLVADNPREAIAAIDYIELDGPYDAPFRADSPARAALLACDAAPQTRACAVEAVHRFARRAWRGPVDVDALDGLLRVYDELAAPLGHEAGVRAAFVAALLSPRFVHRLELDEGDGVRALDDHELATRLAFFLWSSTPDDRLLALADKGALQDDAILEGEVRRMLADPRAGALAERFAAQWLDLGEVERAQRSGELFEGFTPSLRHAMRCETEIFFKSLIDDNASAHRLIDSQRTFVNRELAAHYGLPSGRPVGERSGEDPWFEVDLEGTGRSGVLTHGSILTLTSNPTRTSPVKRGKWILENFLCIEPPPPPPEVEGLITDESPAPVDLRAQLEQHRADPVCAACHAMLDPIGFALESFDAVGRPQRDADGAPVDTSGFYFDGAPFDDLHGLAERLLEERNFSACVVEQTLTYALGRELDEGDRCALDSITARFEADELRMADLFVHVARSPAFRLRQPELDR